jgi:hypothetical protein
MSTGTDDRTGSGMNFVEVLLIQLASSVVARKHASRRKLFFKPEEIPTVAGAR